MNGVIRDVPTVHLMLAGFPCPDVSRSHPGAKTSREQVMQGGLRTGGVFKRGVLAYCNTHSETPHDRLEASLTENVMGLADITDSGNSPLDWVADEWHSAGFWMFPLALDPTLFGFHVHRPRIWMPAVPYDILGDMSTDESAGILISSIHCFMEAGNADPVVLEELLLDVKHPLNVHEV